MKKIGLICIVALMCGSLAACSNSSDTAKNTNNSQSKVAHAKYYFDGNTANLHDIKIHINKVSFYKASEDTSNKKPHLF